MMFRASLVASVGLAAVGVVGLVGVGRPEASPVPGRIAAPTSQLSQLVGFVEARLVRIDPRTLRPLPGRSIASGSGGCASRSGGTACWTNPPWTTSPDGTQLALVRNDLNDVQRLQLVDLGRMRITANVRLGGGPLGALAWLRPERMVALAEANGERQRLLAIDLPTGRVAASRVLDGSVQQLGRTAQELIMLLAPARAIGTARLAVADTSGAVRFVRLARIVAGSKLLGTGAHHRADERVPGLAVDPQGRRAFVVSKTVVAEVDLTSLAISYHTLESSSSFLSRLWRWLEPAAEAKQVSGYYRSARWLSGDLVAISGIDMEQTRRGPAGLLVIDIHGWKIRSLDRGAMRFSVADSLLLATGGNWDVAARKMTGSGLAAYDVDGEKRFRLFDGEDAWVAQVYGGRAYVGLGQKPLRIVDLSSGRIIGTRRQPLPSLLLGAGSGWWGDG